MINICSLKWLQITIINVIYLNIFWQLSNTTNFWQNTKCLSVVGFWYKWQISWKHTVSLSALFNNNNNSAHWILFKIISHKTSSQQTEKQNLLRRFSIFQSIILYFILVHRLRVAFLCIMDWDSCTYVLFLTVFLCRERSALRFTQYTHTHTFTAVKRIFWYFFKKIL